MKKYHKIHPLNVVPHWHVRRTTKLIIVIAVLVCLFPILTVMHLMDELSREREINDDLLVRMWVQDARIMDAQEHGCFSQQFIMPLDERIVRLLN